LSAASPQSTILKLFVGNNTGWRAGIVDSSVFLFNMWCPQLASGYLGSIPSCLNLQWSRLSRSSWRR
jgi:hypothetical protein